MWYDIWVSMGAKAMVSGVIATIEFDNLSSLVAGPR
jgi:hypothetical protein